MQKKKFIQNVTIIVLAVAIIVMSVGYATYYTPMDIKGTTTIEKASWYIHFADAAKVAANTTVSDENITAPTLSTENTSLSFGVKLGLNKAYEFTVDVKNEGTFDAKLTAASLKYSKNSGANIASDSLVFEDGGLKYSITWADGSAIATNYQLKAGETAKIKVRAEYVDENVSSTELTPVIGEAVIGEDATYLFTLDLTFTQAN